MMLNLRSSWQRKRARWLFLVVMVVALMVVPYAAHGRGGPPDHASGPPGHAVGPPLSPPVGPPLSPPVGPPLSPPVGPPLSPPVGPPLSPPVGPPDHAQGSPHWDRATGSMGAELDEAPAVAAKKQGKPAKSAKVRGSK